MTRHATAIITCALVLLQCMLMILGVPLHAFSLTKVTVLLKMSNFQVQIRKPWAESAASGEVAACPAAGVPWWQRHQQDQRQALQQRQ